jgi:rhamnogalacturonyl hydrolase YesR
MKRFFLSSLLGFMLLVCFASSRIVASEPVEDSIFSREFILDIMKRVADYQLKYPSHHYSEKLDFPMGWVPASFYTGVMACYETTGDKKYLDAAISWGEKNKWKTGPRLGYADDIACAQTYLEVYLIKKDPEMIEPIRAVLDSVVILDTPGREDWWWCDALFMGPPVFARIFRATGEKKYLETMHKKFWDNAQFLFSKEDGLFYRDERYFYRRTKNGKKMFWSRGNGWVMAGTVRVLQYLPEKDKMRDWYEHLHRTMARSVTPLQSEDGYWRSSLLDPDEFPSPETSGTAFYCYALAWGINNGYLEPEIYLPAVRKAWKALVEAVHSDGKIGWVQAIGRNPDQVNHEDTQAYGAGGFLLAGSEVIKLEDKK